MKHFVLFLIFFLAFGLSSAGRGSRRRSRDASNTVEAVGQPGIVGQGSPAAEREWLVDPRELHRLLGASWFGECPGGDPNAALDLRRRGDYLASNGCFLLYMELVPSKSLHVALLMSKNLKQSGGRGMQALGAVLPLLEDAASSHPEDPAAPFVWQFLGLVADGQANKALAKAHIRQAISLFEKLIRGGKDPRGTLLLDISTAYANLGVIQFNLKETGDAIQSFSSALEYNEDNVMALKLLAAQLIDSESDFDVANKLLEKARVLSRDEDWEVFYYLGLLRFAEWALPAARVAHQRALDLNPNCLHCYNALGNSYLRDERIEANIRGAISAYEAASTLLGTSEDDGRVEYNLGSAYKAGSRLDEAVKLFEGAVAKSGGFDSSNVRFLVALAHAQAELCEWRVWKDTWPRVFRKANWISSTASGPPFISESSGFIPVSVGLFSNEDSLEYARSYSAQLAASAVKRGLTRFETSRTIPRNFQKLRIGYLSSDLHSGHPVGDLLQSVFLRHDRTRFEVIVYALDSRDSSSALRQKVRRGSDVFREMNGVTEVTLAQTIQEDALDILVHVTGYTKGGRPAIVNTRLAPVQGQFLGSFGTSGSETVDFIVSDRIVSPPEFDAFFSEHVLRMPYSLLCNDHPAVYPLQGSEARGAGGLTRRGLGIPEDAIVLLSLNHPNKYGPEVFTAWLHALRRIPRSVLLFLEYSKHSTSHLMSEGKALGIDPSRFIPHEKFPKPSLFRALGGEVRSHAATGGPVESRQTISVVGGIADIGVDPVTRSGGATTVDVLWAGVPVVTLASDRMTSRITSGAVVAAGVPELLVHSYREYEDFLVQSVPWESASREADVHKSGHVTSLRLLRAKLAAREDTPLFQADDWQNGYEDLLLKAVRSISLREHVPSNE